MRSGTRKLAVVPPSSRHCVGGWVGVGWGGVGEGVWGSMLCMWSVNSKARYKRRMLLLQMEFVLLCCVCGQLTVKLGIKGECFCC